MKRQPLLTKNRIHFLPLCSFRGPFNQLLITRADSLRLVTSLIERTPKTWRSSEASLYLREERRYQTKTKCHVKIQVWLLDVWLFKQKTVIVKLMHWSGIYFYNIDYCTMQRKFINLLRSENSNEHLSKNILEQRSRKDHKGCFSWLNLSYFPKK